ncbi:MAG TPA: tetratricopeptide repeat protein [Thermoanaerobaculia bacterium]|nr:tetratricopeptide repeat protein [Thermoanaerobaculia bacterium]
MSARRALLAVLALLAGASAGCSHSPPKPKTSAEVLLNERMAAVLLREGQAPEAERAYREVLKDDPNNPDLYDGLGSSLLMQGRAKEAVEAFDRAIKISPKKASFRINRGLAYVAIARYSDAEEDFRVADASANADDRLAAAINRGRLHQIQSDYAGAEEQFTIALARDPGSFAAHLGRGVAREGAGNLAGAAEDYLDAVRLQPHSAEANLRLGLTLLELKKGPLGCRYLERAVENDPTGDVGTKARLVLESTPPPCEKPVVPKAS